MTHSIHLPAINLTPTMRCNLRCSLCGVLVPQYEYRPHMRLEDFSAELAAVFQFVDSIEKLQITGGEPLLHADLPLMLTECFKYRDRFERLWLFINCAVPIKPELRDVLIAHKDKVSVHASDYGVRPEIADELIKFFAENGIEYRYLKYFGDEQYSGGWVDQGDFVEHGCSESELIEVFSHCSHVQRGGSWYVRGGQMHWCGRSIRGTELNKIPLREEDYLDIFNGTAEERREKFKKLREAKYILACNYCNGLYGTQDSENRRQAGEQLA